MQAASHVSPENAVRSKANRAMLLLAFAMRIGELALTVVLTSGALIVMIGGPIWFSIKARPLGPLRYRWGTFVGIWSLLLSFGLLGTMLNNRKDSELPIVTIIPALGIVGAIGVLRRKRWGVVAYLASQTAFALLAILVQDSNESLSPALRATAPIVGIGINLWYFGRRWRLLSSPVCGDQPESVFEETDQPQPRPRPLDITDGAETDATKFQ